MPTSSPKPKQKPAKRPTPKLILIATGSEVGLAMEAREKLNAEGTPTRVVSMPCWEFFDAQTAEIPRRSSCRQKSPPASPSKPAFHTAGTNTSATKATLLAVDKFGASAPAEDVFRDYGFTVENVINKAKKLT